MKKRRRGNNNSILIVICAVLFLFGLSFLLFPDRSFKAQLQIYAVTSLALGILYMAYASTASRENSPGDWPMIEGLMDILMGLVLMMSVSTAHTQLLLIFFALWALTGAAARFAYALRAQAPAHKRSGIIIAALCLAACLVFASSLIFADIKISVLMGIGLLLYSAGSFVSPRRK